MNAYELADAIEDWDSDGQWDTPAAIMLRQQADRIAELEKENKAMAEVFEDCGTAVEEANKPVAWVKPDDANDLLGNNYFECIVSNEKLKNDIPLYTHPVNQLSDEELYNLMPINLRADEEDALIFARAIIKASRGEE